MDNIKLGFECGCFSIYYADDLGKISGGLSCCSQHEKAYQQLNNILPLVLVSLKHYVTSETDQPLNNP